MSTITSQQLLERLNWRYATKLFDPSRKISDADWNTLEDALILSPSSGGLQPWKFIVVTDPAVRAKLLPASYGQAQITNASHLVVFASKNNLSEADVDAFISHIGSVRGATVEALAPFRGMLVGGIVKAQDEPARNAWARNQTYIALGNLLTKALPSWALTPVPWKALTARNMTRFSGSKLWATRLRLLPRSAIVPPLGPLRQRPQGAVPQGTAHHQDVSRQDFNSGR